MSSPQELTPLLSDDSLLDEHSKSMIIDLHQREKHHVSGLPTDDPLDPKRRQRVEATWNETWEQPEAIRTTLSLEKPAISDVASKLSNRPIERIIMAGCGDSWTSEIGVRAFYQSLVDIPTEPVEALEFAYYDHQFVDNGTLVIALSSSGTTTRTLEAMLLARSKGAQTLAVTNTAGSPLMEEADATILVHAERKGWPTQASTAAMTVLYALGLELAKRRGLSKSVSDQLEKALHNTPDQIAFVLEEHNDQMATIAKAEAHRHVYLYAAGGPAFACAFFGSSKLKELTPDHAIDIRLEEYHHYRSQKEGDPLFLIAPSGPSIPRALDTARAGQKAGGQVYALVSEGERRFDEFANEVIELPAMDEMLTPLVYAAPLHLFAVHSARHKFEIAEAVE